MNKEYLNFWYKLKIISHKCCSIGLVPIVLKVILLPITKWLQDLKKKAILNGFPKVYLGHRLKQASDLQI